MERGDVRDVIHICPSRGETYECLSFAESEEHAVLIKVIRADEPPEDETEVTICLTIESAIELLGELRHEIESCIHKSKMTDGDRARFNNELDLTILPGAFPFDK